LSLGRLAFSGIKWSAFSQFGRQGSQLITTAILARLLEPSDFGLVGMATVVIGFANLFKDLGTSAAVIQKKTVTEELLSSLFWGNLFIGAALTALVFLLSPHIALFYREPNLIPILRLLSISFLIASFSVLHQSLLTKALKFNTLAKIEVFSAVAGACVGIASALLGLGVWSLVYQMIVTTTLVALLQCKASRWSPTCYFSVNELKQVSKFSLNLTLFNIFNFFTRDVDYILIGRFLGAQELGYYSIAYRLMLYPLQAISGVISRVMFSMYSRMQDNLPLFRKTYLDVINAIALLSFPLMAGLWVLAEPLVLLFLGDAWSPVITLLLILAPVGLVQSVVTTVGSIYQAKGKTDLMFRVGLMTGTVVIVAIVIGLQWGIVGVASLYAIATLLLLIPNMFFPFRLIGLGYQQVAVKLAPVMFSTLTMFIAVFGVKVVLNNHLTLDLVVASCVLIGVFVYLVTLFVLFKLGFFELPFSLERETSEI